MSESNRRRRWPVRAVDRLTDVAGYTSAVAILLAVLVICYGVLLRYFVGASTVWQTEVSVYLLIYATFVGAAYGLKHGDHVAVELVVSRLAPVPRDVVRLLVAVLCVVFALVVGVLAAEMWWEALVEGERSGTASNLPQVVPYAILPIGMLLVVLQYAVIMTDTVHRLRRPHAGSDDAEPSEQGGAGA